MVGDEAPQNAQAWYHFLRLVTASDCTSPEGAETANISVCTLR